MGRGGQTQRRCRGEGAWHTGTGGQDVRLVGRSLLHIVPFILPGMLLLPVTTRACDEVTQLWAMVDGYIQLSVNRSKFNWRSHQKA